MKHAKKLLFSVMVIMLVLAMTMGWASAAEVAPQVLMPEKAVSTVPAKLEGETAKDASYLKTYFGVGEFSAVVSEKEFNAALTKIVGDGVAVEGALTDLEAVKTAVTAANYKELALSYPKYKTDACLSKNGISLVDSDYAAYLACAIDTGMLTAQEAAEAASNGQVSSAETVNLLMAVAEARGLARNFLGYSNDPDISSKLTNAWKSYTLFNDEELEKIGTAIIQNKATTGYNIKKESFDARFLPELTIQYGHSNIKHAHQLMGLLNSEGIVAKVQLEPKVSAFEGRPEWGGKNSSTSAVVETAKDFYLSYGVEYDLKLEFENEEDMKAFDGVIEKYAKKYAGNEAAVGLIAGSWWQPLYTTTVEMSEPEYYLIYDNVVKSNGYFIQSFSLPEQVDAVKAEVEAAGGTVTVEPRYVNAAFYRYLTGDYQ